MLPASIRIPVRPVWEAARPVVVPAAKAVGYGVGSVVMGVIVIRVTGYAIDAVAAVMTATNKAFDAVEDTVDGTYHGIANWREERRIAAEQRKAEKKAAEEQAAREAEERRQRAFDNAVERELNRRVAAGELEIISSAPV